MTPFQDILSGLGSVVADVFDGRTFHVTTAEGFEFDVPGVFNKAHREVTVGDYGAKTWSAVPRIDFPKFYLTEAGILNPGHDLHGASLEVDGTRYEIYEPRDGDVFVRCLLSLDLS